MPSSPQGLTVLSGGKLVWIQKDLSLSPLATLKEFLRAPILSEEEIEDLIRLVKASGGGGR